MAFGAMLGRLLKITGGAQVLADTLVARFGDRRAPFALATRTRPPGTRAPSFGAVLTLLLIPLVLISLDTVLATLATAGVVGEDDGWVLALQLVGQTPVALLITAASSSSAASARAWPPRCRTSVSR